MIVLKDLVELDKKDNHLNFLKILDFDLWMDLPGLLVTLSWMAGGDGCLEDQIVGEPGRTSIISIHPHHQSM